MSHVSCLKVSLLKVSRLKITPLPLLKLSRPLGAWLLNLNAVRNAACSRS